MRLPLLLLLSGCALPLYAYADDITRIEITPLAKAKNTIATDTGSSSYTLDSAMLRNLPQGEFTPLNQELLQAPGAVQDSYGGLHIRGDHANLQYRLNNVLLPEGIGGFGQALDGHIIEKMALLTGALPAQYGYRTAGVIDITTPMAFENGAKTSFMAGSNHTLAGNQEAYGASGQANYYFSGSYLQSDRGLEPPTSGSRLVHDDTQQDNQFGYLSYAFNPEHSLSVIVGNSTNRFEIPNNPGQAQNFTLAGVPAFDSANVNQYQIEHTRFAIASLKGEINADSNYQLAFFTRDSDVLYKPDPAGDLIFNGIAARDKRESLTSGVQNDYSYQVNKANTLRAGWSYSVERASTDTVSRVFPCCDINGQQASSVPFTVTDGSTQPAQLAGLYLQNEWHLQDNLVINYGARMDYYSAYVDERQVSPRIGIVYDATSKTRLHAGYARYFTPPPTELIGNTTLGKFSNTTAQAANSGNNPVKAERSNYLDAGIIQQVTPHLTFGVDGYYKQARHLLDEGQFGEALIYAPFNYAKGWVKGVELSADYRQENMRLYGNFALSRGVGKQVESGQYNFDQAELDYTNSHAVPLDHDQLVTGSLGASYRWHTVTYAGDMLYGSGLRSGFANTDHLPFYTQVNVSATYPFEIGKSGILEAKISIINLFDRVYELRDGSGIGVSAPQYGARRGVFAQLSKAF